MGKRMRIEMYIDFGNKEENENLFDELYKEKHSFEEKFGENFQWEKLEDKRACRITIYRDGSIDDSEDLLQGYREWAIEHLLKFKKVFTPWLKKKFKA